MNPVLMKRGFLAAGVMNIGGVLIFSRLFTNTALNQADPVVMSNFGLLSIILWGLAYMAVGTQERVRWPAAAFAVEKLVYVLVWLLWMKNNAGALGSLFARDFMAGAFYCVYGVNDIVFMVFFALVFFRSPAHE